MTDEFSKALPELRPFLSFFPGFDLSVAPKEGIRPFFASFPPPTNPYPDDVVVGSVTIVGGDNDPLRLLVVSPAQRQSEAPAILAFHGGGGIVGVPEMDLPTYAYFAKEGYVVVSPDYRLAPEHPFPKAAEDGDCTWAYMTSPEGTTQLQIDPKRIALYGSSAGSTLATGISIRLLGKKYAQQPCGVVMDSAVADDRTIYLSQEPGHPDAAYFSVWNRDNAIAARAFVFGAASALPLDAAPLRSTDYNDFVGLPPHYVSSCDLDSLAEHGPEYLKRLEKAGVRATGKVWKSTIHAFVTMVPSSDVAQEARADYVKVFKEMLQ
ncbi:alpha/beta-hydrolase [Meredithblackwellia eburnea MCA 4105]